MKIKTTCSNCDKTIVKYTRKKKINNYFCSIKCKHEFKRKNTYVKISCAYCGKEYVHGMILLNLKLNKKCL